MIQLIPDLLTNELPGVGGVARSRPEDFYVEEIPAYPPSGSGQHTLFAIEKRGIDTFNAIRLIARELGVPAKLIGCAGLKDAQAVSHQQLSVEGIEPSRLMALRFDNIEIRWAEKHRNRLKIGHLRGNRFALRIRQVPPDALGKASRILAILAEQGLPNGYGAQRFGARQTTHLLGRTLLHNDLSGFLAVFLGTPQANDEAEMHAARTCYDQGDLAEALRRWPFPQSTEYRALRILAAGGSARDVYYSLPRELLRLSFGAFQSALFNDLVQERLPALGHLEDGDIAYKHDNGACFNVTAAAAEQGRADRLEISPTAPLLGRKVRLAEGLPGQRERETLAREDLTLEDLRPHGFSLDGDRRPLRVPLEELAVEQDDEGLLLRFRLPPGAFATNLLREVMKTPEKIRSLDEPSSSER